MAKLNTIDMLNLTPNGDTPNTKAVARGLKINLKDLRNELVSTSIVAAR